MSSSSNDSKALASIGILSALVLAFLIFPTFKKGKINLFDIIKFKKINSNNKIFACIGPCIGKKSYE